MRLACRNSIFLVCLLSVQLIQPMTASSAAKRPPIVGIAHVAFQVSNSARARAFYGDVLGYEEPFRLFKENGSVKLTYFKINDRQFVEILPGLAAGQDERLSHFALETTDVEALRLFLAEKGIQTPDKVSKGADGNLNLTLTDPEGHNIEFVQYLPDSLH